MASKVILAASSPFFFELLKRNKHSHPLIYMRGVKQEILDAMVDFLYLGEANVFQDNLDDFLALAEELRLKGLTGKTDDKEIPILETKEHEKIDQNFYLPIQKKIKTVPPQIFHETRISLSVNEQKIVVDPQQLDEQINSMMDFSENSISRKGQGRTKICKICGKEGEVHHIKSHIEANHITGIEHPCNLCGKISRSRDSLRMHRATRHKSSSK